MKGREKWKEKNKQKISHYEGKTQRAWNRTKIFFFISRKMQEDKITPDLSSLII